MSISPYRYRYGAKGVQGSEVGVLRECVSTHLIARLEQILAAIGELQAEHVFLFRVIVGHGARGALQLDRRLKSTNPSEITSF